MGRCRGIGPSIFVLPDDVAELVGKHYQAGLKLRSIARVARGHKRRMLNELQNLIDFTHGEPVLLLRYGV